MDRDEAEFSFCVFMDRDEAEFQWKIYDVAQRALKKKMIFVLVYFRALKSIGCLENSDLENSDLKP